jgi:hypothetical protein
LCPPRYGEILLETNKIAYCVPAGSGGVKNIVNVQETVGSVGALAVGLSWALLAM